LKNLRSLSQLAIWLIAAMLVGLFPALASAEEGSPPLAVTVASDVTTAGLGDNVTFTCVIVNNGYSAVDNLTATASLTGAIPLDKSSLGPGENVTALVVYSIQTSHYPGPLQVTFTIKGTAAEGAAFEVSGSSAPVTLEEDDSDDDDDSASTRAEILKLRGVPGRGIDRAPGLQKPFTENSQAADHAGKKSKDKNKNK